MKLRARYFFQSFGKHQPNRSFETKFAVKMSKEREEITEKFLRLLAGAFDYEAALKYHGITEDEIENLREMCKSSERIPKSLPDQFHLTVLASYMKNYDKSVNAIHNYCKLIKETPEWFRKRDIMSDIVQLAFDHQYFFSLPPIPGKNYNLVYHALLSYEPKHYVFDESEQAFMMTLETCIYDNGPRDGVVFLFDMKGSKISHVFQPRLRSLRQLMRFVEDGCPFKIRAVRIFSVNLECR